MYEWDEKTLEDLKVLVTQFGIPGKNLHLYHALDECIAVFWLILSSDVEELKEAVLRAADLLQTKGVLQVFIGDELVLECLDPGIHTFSALFRHQYYTRFSGAYLGGALGAHVSLA